MGMHDAGRRVRRAIARTATCGGRGVPANGSGAGRAMRVWCVLRGGVALVSAALLFAVIAFTHPLGALAATVTVNNTSDSLFGTAADCAAGNAGTCSLRDAVAYANANDGTTITFGLPNHSTIPLASHQSLTLTRTTGSGTTITGPGAAALALDGLCTVSNGYCISGIGGLPIFWMNSGVTASISGLTLQHGFGVTDGNGNPLGSGAIYNRGRLTVTDSTFSINYGQVGGTIYNGPGANLTLTNSTISGGQSAHQGGGILNEGTLTATNCTISGSKNSTGGGGGIYNTGTVTLTNCTISGNSSPGPAGGISTGNPGAVLTVTNSTISGNTAAGGDGGGIYIFGGTLTVANSTISGNSATYGGGIENYTATATVTNSTFSGNSAASYGGGIENNGTLTVTNSTFSGNSATLRGGGIATFQTLAVTNTLIAGNTSSRGPDIFNNPSSGGHNVIGKSDSSVGWIASDLTGTIASPLNPLLGTLGSYGGPTKTIPLLPGSPAIDAGDDTVCASTTTPAGAAVGGRDQRGITRPQGAHCDSGAFESQGFTLASTSGDEQNAPVGTAFSSPLVVTVASANGEPVDGGVVTFTGPTSGAGITPNPVTATIGATTTGQAQVTLTANGTAGANYSVTAGAAGTSPATVTFTLTNTAPPGPTLTAIAPTSGSTAGGTSVTLSGTGFVAGATVSFDGVDATNVVVVNGTTITATTPAHAAGAVDVVVATNGATLTLAGSYTYGVVNPLPPQQPPGPASGPPSPLPAVRPPGTTGGPAPNPVPASRP